MSVSEFINRYREAFGASVSLPIALWYGDEPVTEIKRIPRCFIGAISKVRDGYLLTLCSENVKCGGGGTYTTFREMPEYVPQFVSGVEHYKKTAKMVQEYANELGITLSDKPYLNFVRVDKLEDWEKVEAVLFFATPDALSGLCTWAFYDNNSTDAVVTRFASGCASIITFAVKENREKGRSCFLGMLDPSARPLIPENELSFAIPMSRFKEMLGTMNDSALFQKAFSILKKRINRSTQDNLSC